MNSQLLLETILKNPHKSKVPEIIHMPGDNHQAPQDESTELQYQIHWARLQPPGPLSLWFWTTDVEYRGGTEASRRTMLMDKTVELQERVQDGEGSFSRKWSKSRICEAIGHNVEFAEEENFELLETALHQLCKVQIVRMNENEKKLLFVPNDLRLWDPNYTILWTRERYRSAGETESKQMTLRELGAWISNREHEGWKVEWPVAEGKMETLKTAWDALNRGNPPRGPGQSGRYLKEEYAKALGKHQAIHWLQFGSLETQGVKVEP